MTCGQYAPAPVRFAPNNCGPSLPITDTSNQTGPGTRGIRRSLISRYRQRGALIATLLGLLIVILNTTVVNVALARIGGNLGVPAASLQWVADAYTLTFATL